MEVSSDLALRVYEHVFWGIDRPLGDTMDESGTSTPVAIPAGVPWYATHPDHRLPASFLAELAAEVTAGGITGLSLASCRALDDDAFAHLRAAPGLEILDLFNTRIGNAGIAHLSDLVELRVLNLAGTELGVEPSAEPGADAATTTAAIDVITGLPALERLHLGWTAIDDNALAKLAEMPTLRHLDVRATKITDAGMKHLARMSGLIALGLQETGVGDAGVRALAPLAATLERLDLGYTQVTDACVPALASFQQLRALTLRATAIDSARDAELIAAVPALGDETRGPQGIQQGLIR